MIIKIFRNTKYGVLKITLDEAGLELYQSRKWNITADDRTFYLYSYSKVKGSMYTIKSRSYSMHRILLGLENNKKFLACHINHDGLDNRLSNLRKCTPSQSQANRRVNRQVGARKKLSKYKGVSWDDKETM